jgi:hypothetical protein
MSENGDPKNEAQGMYVVYRMVVGASNEAPKRQAVGIAMAPNAKRAAAVFESAWGRTVAVPAPEAPTEDLLRTCVTAICGVLGEFRQMMQASAQAAAAGAAVQDLDARLRGRGGPGGRH